MTTRISLSHKTSYEFDRAVQASTHLIRLRPAPHTRIPILAYSFSVTPKRCFTVWQQDPFGNYIANVHIPEKISHLIITVDLIADLGSINPFDFVIEDYAKYYPFYYHSRLKQELGPYFTLSEHGPLFKEWINNIKMDPAPILDALAYLNRLVHREVVYNLRLEPGILSADETLTMKRGSCRDMSWLLLQTLRYFGFAARFASGYLVQLKYGSYFSYKHREIEKDFVDLHAWVEVYLPGAGWIGLDPTSGYFTSECHIPLSCTPEPESAAPVVGFTEVCNVNFNITMEVKRLEMLGPMTFVDHYNEHVWREINELALIIDNHLDAYNVRLTMGGEPTFISKDHADEPEWQYSALGEEKFVRGTMLLEKLFTRFAKGGFMFYGIGKFYAGEQLPRFILSCYWHKDGKTLWHNESLLADPTKKGSSQLACAKMLIERIASHLELSSKLIIDAYEDLALLQLLKGQDIDKKALKDELPQGFVLPISFDAKSQKLNEEQWKIPRDRLYLIPGTSPLGFRLPLNHVERFVKGYIEKDFPTALTVENRNGNLLVFLPPIYEFDHFMMILDAIEKSALELNFSIILEGYAPIDQASLHKIHITPDPGVLEVNINPAQNWTELENTIHDLYKEAKSVGLTAERYLIDGRHVGTGGGNHITIGGKTLDDSPILRRPDLLQSIITYAQHHPSMSYFFSGLFVGPTSQAPRPDESRHDKLYELEIAFSQLLNHPKKGYWFLDRLLRNLLTDNEGNTHRAEICIDKLYAPKANGRQGLIEFRGFEMMPHPHMCLLEMLLIRALVSYFWQVPYKKELVRYSSELHDKFLLPYFLWGDFCQVLKDLKSFGYDFKEEWFLPFLEFRFPLYGKTRIEDMDIELRMALEPWHVINTEEKQETSRVVDATTERVQILINNLTPNRYIVTCNERRVPLHQTKKSGQYIAGIRFKARNLTLALHPHLPVNTPLIFDIYDCWHMRSVGGFTYYSEHPGGINYKKNPINAEEAESRMISRFIEHGYNPHMKYPELEECSVEYPYTLDLRRPKKIGI